MAVGGRIVPFRCEETRGIRSGKRSRWLLRRFRELFLTLQDNYDLRDRKRELGAEPDIIAPRAA